METKQASPAKLSLAHQRLMRDLCSLQDLVASDSKASLPQLRNGLSATYTHVCEHFRLEEQGGYFDNIAENEPRLQHAADQLRDDHRQLRRSLDNLHGEAIVAAGPSEVLLDKVRQWIQRLMQHEWRENDLIQDAVDADLSAQD